MSSLAAPSAFSSASDQTNKTLMFTTLMSGNRNSLNCCFPAFSRFYAQQVPAQSESCGYRAATALPTGITGAEDGSDLQVQTSKAAFAWKREFLLK